MRRKTLDRLLILAVLLLVTVWLVLPFTLAMLWSLVDPGHPWSYPHALPPVLSFQRWVTIWTTSSLAEALMNSYMLAPSVAVLSLILAMPTAFAFGRLDFPGKGIAQVLALVPLIMPGLSFVVAIFFSSLLFSLHIYWKFAAILIGHTVLFLPFAIRILSVSFGLVRQDLIDAARDLRAPPWVVFRTAYLPVLKPGILSSLIIVFIYSIEEFAVSYVIGSPDFTTVPTILYSYLGYNFIRPNAAVVSLILVVPNVILMLLLERLLKSANPASITGKG